MELLSEDIDVLIYSGGLALNCSANMTLASICRAYAVADWRALSPSRSSYGRSGAINLRCSWGLAAATNQTWCGMN
jgi:hypothetical protein